MKKILILIALLAIALVSLVGAISYSDCIETYCNADYEECSKSVCSGAVGDCTDSSCEQIYRGESSSQCIGACRILSDDSACLDEMMPAIADCMTECWGVEKPAYCAEACVTGLHDQFSHCVARKKTECPPNSIQENFWGMPKGPDTCVKGCCCGYGGEGGFKPVGWTSNARYDWDGAGNCVEIQPPQHGDCSPGSTFSETAPSYYSYPVQGGSCNCNQGYRPNYPKTACLKCGGASSPTNEYCEYEKGENCDSCPEDCGCGDPTFETCLPTYERSNLIGCYKKTPVATIIQGDVRVVDKNNNERRLEQGKPILPGEKVRLYTNRDADTFVEIHWPDGKIGRAILPKEAYGDEEYDEFVIGESRSTTGEFDSTIDIIIDSIDAGEQGFKIGWWLGTVYKGVKLASIRGLRFVGGTVSSVILDTSAPLGTGITYININSEVVIQPMSDGSLMLTTLEGSPEIVYAGGNVTVPAGQYSVIGANGVPSQPQPFDPSKLDRWWERYGTQDGDNTLVIILVVAAAAVALLAVFILWRRRVKKT